MYDVVIALAFRQHGAFSTAQAEVAGVCRSWLHRHERHGLIVRRAHGVYVLASAPGGPCQDLMVHLLAAGAGALATGDSGLGLWCRELTMPRRPVIAIPPNCGYRSPVAEVRRSHDLDQARPGVVDGVPVVGVVRALIDASVGRTVDQVESRIDACRRELGFPVGALVDGLRRHARPGRTGVAVFRRAVQRLGREVTDSDFERMVIKDLLAAGVAEPRLHHLVRLPGEDPIELDLDWPGLRLDVELDGRDHTDRARQALRDRQRDRLLTAVGWRVVRFLWREYVADPDRVVAEIARLVAGAGVRA